MNNGPDILLINPPFDRLHGKFREYFPMGLAYLAGALKSAGFTAAVYNAEAPRSRSEVWDQRSSEMLAGRERYVMALDDADHPVWQEARRILRETRPRMVGVSVWSEKVAAARLISAISKQLDPSVPVIWGGPHATLRVEECAAQAGVDYVVKGEGERTIVELARELLSGRPAAEGIRGVYRRDPASGEVRGEDRPLEMDLDSLPQPDWESNLSADDWPGRVGGAREMISSRGCPYPCEYCAVQVLWGRKVRFHSVERVVDEIVHRLKTTGPGRFGFWDDSFTLDRTRTEAICRAFIDRSLQIEWACMTRADLVDAELIGLLKRAGCNRVTFGVESGSPRILKLTRKGESLEAIERAFRTCRDAGMIYGAYYMIGFPDETEADIAMTLSHMRRCGAASVGLGVFTPYPGTPQYRRAVELGLLQEPVDWTKIGRCSAHTHFVAGIPADRFRTLVEDAFRLVDRVNQKPLDRVKGAARRSLKACARFLGRGRAERT